MANIVAMIPTLSMEMDALCEDKRHCQTITLKCTSGGAQFLNFQLWKWIENSVYSMICLIVPIQIWNKFAFEPTFMLWAYFASHYQMWYFLSKCWWSIKCNAWDCLGNPHSLVGPENNISIVRKTNILKFHPIHFVGSWEDQKENIQWCWRILRTSLELKFYKDGKRPFLSRLWIHSIIYQNPYLV